MGKNKKIGKLIKSNQDFNRITHYKSAKNNDKKDKNKWADDTWH